MNKYYVKINNIGEFWYEDRNMEKFRRVFGSPFFFNLGAVGYVLRW